MRSKNFTFEPDSPVDCATLQIAGLYCVTVFVASLVSNTYLLMIFWKSKKRITPISLVIVVHTVGSLFGTFVQMPAVTINAFMCRFTFGKLGCRIIGFLMYSNGLFSIVLTVLVSLFRCYIASKRYTKQPLRWRISIYGILLSALVSILFSAMPLFGWSHYSLEGAHISCSIEWKSKDKDTVSYNVTALILFFFIPCIILLASNIKLFLIFNASSRKFSCFHTSRQVAKKEKEKKNLKAVSVSLIAGHLISWSPYAITSMLSMFLDACAISPLVTTIPTLFAKSSLLWPSLIFMNTSKDFQKLKRGLKQDFSTWTNNSSVRENSVALVNQIQLKDYHSLSSNAIISSVVMTETSFKKKTVD